MIKEVKKHHFYIQSHYSKKIGIYVIDIVNDDVHYRRIFLMVVDTELSGIDLLRNLKIVLKNYEHLQSNRR